MNAPNPPHWTLNSSFVVFLSVWVHLGLFCYGSKLNAKWAELVQLFQKFMPRSRVRFFHNECKPIHPHWTLNSCFVLFRSVWGHLGPFRCFTILGSKQDELLQLMQKFKPKSCVRIFCTKSAQSTPSDPKLMFWCVS